MGSPNLADEGASTGREFDTTFRELELSHELTLFFNKLEATAATQPQGFIPPLSKDDMPPWMWKMLVEAIKSRPRHSQQGTLQTEVRSNEGGYLTNEEFAALQQLYLSLLQSQDVDNGCMHSPLPPHSRQLGQVKGGQGYTNANLGVRNNSQTFARSPLAPPLSASSSMSSVFMPSPRPAPNQLHNTSTARLQYHPSQERLDLLSVDPRQRTTSPTALTAASPTAWPFNFEFSPSGHN